MKYDGELLKFTDAFIINLAPVPQKEPFYDATGGPFTHSKISKYVELYTEDGIRGVCPCSSIMEKTILPLIMTGEKRSFAQWMHKVYWSCRNSGFDGETAGEVGKLEYLLTDILAKRAGMPFHRFLGALKDSVTVYGSGGSTHLSGAALAGEMEHFMDCGHKTVKMKVGTDFATKIDYDVERVRLVRETIGPDAELAIDGNHSFTVQEGGLPLLACPLIATAGDDAMEEFLEVCNQPVLDCMEVTVERRGGRFYLPDIPGLPFRLDMKWLKKNGYLLSYERYS